MAHMKSVLWCQIGAGHNGLSSQVFLIYCFSLEFGNTTLNGLTSGTQFSWSVGICRA